jgi:ELWxxDGT repeat protein
MTSFNATWCRRADRRRRSAIQPRLEQMEPRALLTATAWDIVPGAQGLGPARMLAVGSELYFESGDRLWWSNGTEAGTRKVLGVSNLSLSRIKSMVGQGPTLYLSLDSDGNNWAELWTAETGMARQLQPTVEDYNPTSLASIGGVVYFTNFVSPVSQWSLMRFPEPHTVYSTTQGESYGIGRLTGVGDRVFFAASEDDRGWEPYVHDPALPGSPDDRTFRLRDIFAGSTPDYMGSQPASFTAVGNLCYFTADDHVNGRELWVSDGTTPGTRMISIADGPTGSSPTSLFAFGDTLVFQARRGGVTSLFRLDAGGVPEALLPIDSLADAEVVGDTLFLVLAPPGGSAGLYAMGSAGNLTPVVSADPFLAFSAPSNLTRLGDSLCFAATRNTTGRQTVWTLASLTRAIPIASAMQSVSQLVVTTEGLFATGSGVGPTGQNVGTELWRVTTELHRPNASDDARTVPFDTPITISALLNDTDADRDPLKILRTTAPRHGKVQIIDGQKLRYTPTPGYDGTDSFVYTASDGMLTSSATVRLTVKPPDASSYPVVSFEKSGSAWVENGGTASIRVRLSKAFSRTVSVGVQFTGVGRQPLSTTDVRRLSTLPLTFAPGSTVQTLRYQIVNDSSPEPTETAQIRLVSPTSCRLGTPSLHVLAVSANDGDRAAWSRLISIPEQPAAGIAQALDPATGSRVQSRFAARHRRR